MQLSTNDIQNVLTLLESIQDNVSRLTAILQPSNDGEDSDTLDPKSPLNKIGINLSPRGVEVAYRMFDAGKTRYAVSEALGMSYGAATHRYHAWEKLGGKNRQRQPLDIRESYEQKYDPNGRDVLSSKNKVAAAGRWGDQTEIEKQRERHRDFMESSPKPSQPT